MPRSVKSMEALAAAARKAAKTPKERPPPARRKPAAAAKTTEADAPPLPHLTPTGEPGVFLNGMGQRVDANGVLLRFLTPDNEEEYGAKLIGGPVDSPAKVMQRIALDPLLPLSLRLDAAKGAAPYFDKKKPIAIEQKSDDNVFDVAAIAALPRAKRIEMLRMLGEVGVDVSFLDGLKK